MNMHKEINGWKAPFYMLGWLFGILSPVFWLVQLGGYAFFDNPQQSNSVPFFNKGFHRRVWEYGLVVSCVLVIGILWLIVS